MSTYKNSKYIRSLASEQFPDLGSKLNEALSDITNRTQTLAQHTNTATQGKVDPPPAINSVSVTGQNGHFNVAITDNGQIYRGIQYYVEHADNAAFTNPTVIHIGDARTHNEYLGNVTRYWRAYSAYATGPPSSPSYHGGRSAPLPVTGGGVTGGPAFQPSQGSGTGTPGQGLSGPGPVPFRSPDGAPPIRGSIAGTGGSSSGPMYQPSIAGVPAGGGFAGGGSSSGGGGAGVMQFVTVTQSGLATLAASLTPSSLVTAYVSDYAHTLVWAGAGWRYDDASNAAGHVIMSLVDPSPSAGWQLCDGSATTQLNGDGSVTSVTVPDYTASPSYMELGATASAAIVAPVAPTLTINPFTPAGTVSAPTWTGSVTASFTGTPFTFPTAAITAAAGGLTVLIGPLTYTPGGSVAASVSGSNSAPVFTGTPGTPTGTVGSNGTPQTGQLRGWFRR